MKSATHGGMMAILHLACIDSAFNLWHTIRRSDGTSWFPFGDVRTVIRGGHPGSFAPDSFIDLDCAGVGGTDLHISLLTAHNGITGDGIVHTVRDVNGTWTPFGNARQVAQIQNGVISSVATTEINRQLGLCAAIQTRTGQAISTHKRLFYTIRGGAGAWRRPQAVGGSFLDIACAGDGNQFHFCGVVFDNQGVRLYELEHAMGPLAGPFTPFGDVRQAVLNDNPGSVDPGPFGSVSCAVIAGELHVCVTAGGRIFHTIRRSVGTWSSFEDVLNRVPVNPAPPAAIGELSCAEVNGELNVVCVDGSGRLWNSIHSNGAWSSFEDVIGNILVQNPSSPNPTLPILKVAITDTVL